MMELQKEQLRAALEKQYQEKVDRLVKKHGAEMDKATQARKKVCLLGWSGYYCWLCGWVGGMR